MPTKEWVTLTKPLSEGPVQVRRLIGTEGISELYLFDLDFDVPRQTVISFETVLGKPASLLIAGRELGKSGSQLPRHLHGIVSKLSEIGFDESFVRYRMRIVPELWLLSKRFNCRVFQQQSVPEILRTLFGGLHVKFELRETYHEHNYCVQYQESDFAFASRLMEEEGIFYYFTNDSDAATLHIADTSSLAPDLPGETTLDFDPIVGGNRSDDRIQRWEKHQELCRSSYRVWDHSFELPSHNLEASSSITSQVQVGTVSHRLDLGSSHRLESFEYPGSYAHRFDGIGSQGNEQTEKLDTIFQQNAQTAEVRIEEEAASSLVIEGTSDCRRLMPGYQFILGRHTTGNGKYLIRRVEHELDVARARSGGEQETKYFNRFECQPSQLVYRPPRTTPRPVIYGAQSATVVGPEEIFTDKYGRVKVQFRWDRYGRKDENSSCWVRVAKTWAGGNWGQVTIPRVGQEVLVTFLEGDPDAPIIVGSVYNAGQMPPFTLPDSKRISGIKTSTEGGSSSDFHGLAFDDTSGSELIQFRSQKNMIVETKNSHSLTVPNEHATFVGSLHRHVVGGGFLTSGSSSGSGGGSDSSDWDQITVGASYGFAFATTIGLDFQSNLGVLENVMMLRHNESWFDPISSLIATKGEDVPASVLALGSCLSHSGWVVGQDSSLIYGYQFQSTRGAHFEYKTNDAFTKSSLISIFTVLATADNLAVSVLQALETGWSETTDREVYLSLWVVKVLCQYLCGYVEALNITSGILSEEEQRLQNIETNITNLTTRVGNAETAASTATMLGQTATNTAVVTSTATNALTAQQTNLTNTLTNVENAVTNLQGIATHLNAVANGDFQVSTTNGSISLAAATTGDDAPGVELSAGRGSNAGTVTVTAGGSVAINTSIGANAVFNANADGYANVALNIPASGTVFLGTGDTSLAIDDSDTELILQALDVEAGEGSTLTIQPTQIVGTSSANSGANNSQATLATTGITLSYGPTSDVTASVKIDDSGITLTVGSTTLTITSTQVEFNVNGGATSQVLSSSGLTETASSIANNS